MRVLRYTLKGVGLTASREWLARSIAQFAGLRGVGVYTAPAFFLDGGEV